MTWGITWNKIYPGAKAKKHKMHPANNLDATSIIRSMIT